MADEDFSVAIKYIHQCVEACGVDFHGDDGGVWESLGELACFGALAGAVVDDCVVVAVGDGVDDIA